MNKNICIISYISMICLLSACSGAIVIPEKPVTSPTTVISTKPSDIKILPSLINVKPSKFEPINTEQVSKINDVIMASPLPSVSPINNETMLTYFTAPLPVTKDIEHTQQATPCDVAVPKESLQCQIYLTAKPVYSYGKPVPPGLVSGEINLIFKDKYKIRYSQVENKFISLVGIDISSINKILISNNIGKTIFYSNSSNESDAEKYEKEFGPNPLSSYMFGVKDINITDLILALRNNPFVFEVNYQEPFSGGAGGGA